MAEYSIKDLERLSGIKAHTLRIWEKRYQLISPQRTDTNIRYYTDEDLKKILNVAVLNDNGYKISKIAILNDKQLRDLVHEISIQNTGSNALVDKLTFSMISLNENDFISTFNEIVKTKGLHQTIYDILYPFLEKIGVLWQVETINPAHEHFVSNLIRQKVLVEIEKLPIPTEQENKGFVLFLPEHELHEMGLLFYHYVIRKLGFKSLYLGQAVPLPDLKEANEIFKGDYFVTSFTVIPEKETIDTLIDKYKDEFPEQHFWVGGSQSLKEKKVDNFTFFHQLKDIEKLLESLAKN